MIVMAPCIRGCFEFTQLANHQFALIRVYSRNSRLLFPISVYQRKSAAKVL